MVGSGSGRALLLTRQVLRPEKARVPLQRTERPTLGAVARCGAWGDSACARGGRLANAQAGELKKLGVRGTLVNGAAKFEAAKSGQAPPVWFVFSGASRARPGGVRGCGCRRRGSSTCSRGSMCLPALPHAMRQSACPRPTDHFD